MEPFLGTEALSSGALTRGALRWNYRAVLPNVYLPRDETPTLEDRTIAAWLWTGRRGVVAGRAAAAIWGVTGIEAGTPIELIGPHARPHPGVIVREERIADDEIRTWQGLRVTSPARTALDLGRRLPTGLAVEHLDVLCRVACLTRDEVEQQLQRYRGVRGIPQARVALRLMDGGARCPEETRMRLLLYTNGVPRPSTGILVEDGGRVARIGMGWEGIKLGVSYFAPLEAGVGVAAGDLVHHEIVARTGWTEVGYVGMANAGLIARRVRSEVWRRRARRV
ncbi:hypothetical protein MMAD_43890 [Mycolicibacterium madagascariense]|uniref:Uncharacterized protein n=1 Tax=Mycolicibacterium madagascariense TaxID=212765 RepID=A0A7I7XLJ9_9MYCO|nr:hypothetical protein [Mycolicibacterium madagascariense]MCV7012418.1 hypothetical protein [Mycolicibacterium madagascariense]BBZ30094.1 hypothetical protein MMAD_43890 [Mycolicibacterium madagascariense]